MAQYVFEYMVRERGLESEIADPWYTGNFDITYDDIDEGCKAFLEHLHG